MNTVKVQEIDWKVKIADIDHKLSMTESEKKQAQLTSKKIKYFEYVAIVTGVLAIVAFTKQFL